MSDETTILCALAFLKEKQTFSKNVMAQIRGSNSFRSIIEELHRIGEKKSVYAQFEPFFS